MAGSTSSVIAVELSKPPMIALAMGAWVSPPSPNPMASGIMARIVVVAVMRIGRKPPSPCLLDGFHEGIAIPCSKEVDVIHQQDGVVDHDAAQHDTADIGLNIKGGVCKEKHQNDTRWQPWGLKTSPQRDIGVIHKAMP